MLGFSSAHRSGKTTTAKLVAERLGLPFMDGSFGKLAAELGYNSVDTMSAAARIEMQERCLALHVAKIQSSPRPAIIDRTPLDYIGYAIAEVPMHGGLEPEISRRIHAYMENCLEVTRQHYGAIVVLDPLPTYTEEAGKPPPCIAYQHHIQIVIEGAARRVADPVRIGWVTGGFDLEKRVRAAAGFFANTLMGLGEDRAGEILH